MLGVDVGEQELLTLEDADESGAGQVADDAVAAVAADQPACGDRLGFAALDEHRRNAVVRLPEALERGAELDRAAEFRQPQPQCLLDPPLGRDQARGIGHIGT